MEKTINQKEEPVYLTLYVAGDTQRCRNALSNLKDICKGDLNDRCRIEIIDILENPDSAKREQIVAIPTLVRQRQRETVSAKRIIGDLSNASKVLRALDL